MASFWQRVFGARKSVTTSHDLLRELMRGSETKAGQRVNVQNALGVSVVNACARALSEGVATPPWRVLQESADGRKRVPVKDHPLYRVLHDRPNEWQTSFEYRETLMWHAVLTGGHYSFINRVRGDVVELIPFRPEQVRTERNEDTYEITYHVRGKSGREQPFPQSAIWHVRGPSWDSVAGLEVVKLAREAIGLAMAIEEQQATFYDLGAQPSGTLSVKDTLEPDQYKKLREWIDKEHAGAKSMWRPMIVDRGAEWKQTQQSGLDSQTLEQRRNQIEEICRFFRVYPIIVMHSDKAQTYATAEQMFLAHLIHSLTPWHVRIEQSANANLLSEKDRRAGVYTKFKTEALMRGSLKDTKDFLLGLTNGGVIYVNEARSILDLDADDDPASDKLRTPVNAVAPADVPDPPNTDDNPTPPPADA